MLRLDVAQRRLEPVHVHQRVVIALAQPLRRRLRRRRRQPERGGLLGDHPDVRQPLAPVHVAHVAVRRLLARELVVARGPPVLLACLVNGRAKHVPNAHALLVAAEAASPLPPLLAQQRLGRVGHDAEQHERRLGGGSRHDADVQ
eukprot:scaffold39482_cov63-Phaeocystis_antarctica.AAC.3